MTAREPHRDPDEGGDSASRRSRREYLAACAGAAVATAAGLAGCLGDGPTAAPDPWTNVERGDPPGTIVEGTARLGSGQYAAVPIRWPESEGSGILSGRIAERLALPLDVHTLAPDALAAYRRGEALDGISAASATGEPAVSFRGIRLPHDEYVLVIDNTRLGGEPPYDEIRVSVSVSLEY